MSLAIQSRALLRRYYYSQLRSPLKSLLKFIVVPIAGIVMLLVLLIKYEVKDIEGFISYLVMAFSSLQFYSFTHYLVTDKITGMKSLMLTMGLKRSTYYFANYVTLFLCLIPYMIALGLICIIYLFDGTEQSLTGIFSLFILLVFQYVGLSFVAAAMIPSTKMLVIVMIIIITQYIYHPIVLLLIKKSEKSLWSFILFMASISPFEGIAIVADGFRMCKNECTKITFDPDYYLICQPVYMNLIAMTFWSIVTIIFSYWFDGINLGQSKAASLIQLFCSKLTNSCYQAKNNLNLYGDSLVEIARNCEYFERTDNSRREIGIEICNVTKRFSNNSNAVNVVDDLSLNIYKGETTLLLGHNGAGKTTLMNIILGRLNPTTGNVNISNKDSIDLGFCPQESILDDNLSVEQHLRLFLDLKLSSMSPLERDQHIQSTLKDVSLTNHDYKLPGELSGGMRRKLSLALAFVGKSQVLILDEPSSGLDPDSRFFIWNAIRRYRQQRTVLLSTQHMEEADYLGDRIAIMSEGKLICCGSSLFLNNVLGNCYKLRVQCQKSFKDRIMILVGKYFAQAKIVNISLHNELEMELRFELIDDKTQDAELNLINLLDYIESNDISIHGVKSFILKSSSIEDVMLNTAKQTLGKNFSYDNPQEVKISLEENSTYDNIDILTRNQKEQDESFWNAQRLILYALIVKHWQTYKTDYKSVIFLRIILVLIPTFCICYNFSSYYLRPLTSLGIDKILMILHLVYFPTMEKTSRFKTLQLTSCANPIVYWLSQLVVDMASIILLVVYVNIFQIILFTNGVYLVSTFEIHLILTVSILLFGTSGALIAYIISNVLSDGKTAILNFTLFFAISPVMFFLTQAISLATSLKAIWLSDFSDLFFRILFPTVTLEYIMSGLITECYLKSPSSVDCKPEGNVSPVLFGLIFFIFQIVLYGAILFAVEYMNLDLAWYFRLKNIFAHCRKIEEPKEDGPIDEDVVRESISAMSQFGVDVGKSRTSLIASDLKKSYIYGLPVVDKLSFVVNKGECFGLLGINGAGKSTTFSMLSGELQPDRGSIYINGYHHYTKYRKEISYDPQMEPATFLTCSQALILMARLRRLKESCIPDMVKSILELFRMKEYTNMRFDQLSGGTKKKLALGMSLIGNPPVALLDEPTAGVDPVAKVYIWYLLRSLRLRRNSSILISSHAMEECEAVCDRIAIMARGKLRCIGTFLHLRSKFLQGCRLKIQLAKTDNVDETNKLTKKIHSRLESDFGNSVKLVDTNVNSAIFNISDSSVKRSSLFKILRQFKQHVPNLYYTVNDSSLEDIFIALAREQDESLIEKDDDL